PPERYWFAASWMICWPSGVMLYLSQSKNTRYTWWVGGGGGAGGAGGGGAGGGAPNFIVKLATMLCVLYPDLYFVVFGGKPNGGQRATPLFLKVGSTVAR